MYGLWAMAVGGSFQWHAICFNQLENCSKVFPTQLSIYVMTHEWLEIEIKFLK